MPDTLAEMLTSKEAVEAVADVLWPHWVSEPHRADAAGDAVTLRLCDLLTGDAELYPVTYADCPPPDLVALLVAWAKAHLDRSPTEWARARDLALHPWLTERTR